MATFADQRVYCGGLTAQNFFHCMHSHPLKDAVEVGAAVRGSQRCRRAGGGQRARLMEHACPYSSSHGCGCSCCYSFGYGC